MNHSNSENSNSDIMCAKTQESVSLLDQLKCFMVSFSG